MTWWRAIAYVGDALFAGVAGYVLGRWRALRGRAERLERLP